MKKILSKREKRIVSKLLAYKKRCERAPGHAFTANKEAEKLVKKDWNAFLFAVIFDQQKRAEDVWAIPLELRKRLGHLNVYKISVMNIRSLIKIFRTPTVLHQYVNKMPSWAKSACKKLIGEYKGKTENIWKNTKEAKEIIRRFEDFEGIGQKKATMATNFLADYFNIPITGRRNIDISVDEMIQRVFKRLGLVTKDASKCDIITKARILRPSFPGELDYPCWEIGREWCTKQTYCYYADEKGDDNCPLVNECPIAKKEKNKGKQRDKGDD